MRQVQERDLRTGSITDLKLALAPKYGLRTGLKTGGELLEILIVQARRQPWMLVLFSALCLNLLLAPTVLAATGATLTRQTAYAIGLLLLVTLGLSVYLFVVIFQPERF